MTDLVTRLRYGSIDDDLLDAAKEAADEIERLQNNIDCMREEIEALRELLRICRAERDELAAKNYQMRDALKRQVDNVTVWLETGLPATPDESRSIYEQMRGALLE